MPIGTGGAFQLDPSLFGLPALGEQIGRFAELREFRKERDEEKADRDEEQEFQRNVQQFNNLLALGDRESAAQFHNLVFGTQAEARLTGDEAIDRLFTEGLQAAAQGGQPTPFQQDLINTRVFGSLDPEADREILQNEAVRSGFLAEYQQLINQGVPSEQALTRAQTRAQQLANEASARENQQRLALDAIIAADPSIPGNSYLEATALGNVTDQQLAQALTRGQTELTGAQVLETRRRASLLLTQRRALRAEMAQMAATNPQSTAALEAAKPDIEGIGALVAGQVPEALVIEFVLNPQSTRVAGPARELLEEAAETYRTEIRSSMEAAIRESDPDAAADLLILKNPDEFGPDMLNVAMSRFINRNFGEGTATLEPGGWFGPSLETSIAAEELLAAVNAQEGIVGNLEDIEAVVQEDRTAMIEEWGSEEAALERLNNILPEMETDEERAYVQALIDSFAPPEVTDELTGETLPTQSAEPGQIPPSAGIPDSVEALRERVQGLSSNDQIRARKIFSEIEGLKARIKLHTRPDAPAERRATVSQSEAELSAKVEELRLLLGSS